MKKIKFESKEIKKQRSSGITLIALVITIIVLLILAAISLTMLTGDNSILKRAVDAKEQTERAEIEEALRLAYIDLVGNDWLNYSNKASLDEAVTIVQNQGYKDKIKGISGGEYKLSSENIILSKTAPDNTQEIKLEKDTSTSSGGTWYAVINGKYFKIEENDGDIKIAKEPSNVDPNSGASGDTISITSSDVTITKVDGKDIAKSDVTAGDTIKVTALNEGSSKITINANGKTYTANLTVVGTIEQAPANLDGALELLAATDNPNGKNQELKDIVMTTSNPDVATVTTEGIVKCNKVADKEVIISAKQGETTRYFKVNSTATLATRTKMDSNKTINGQTTGTANNPIIPKDFYPVNTEKAKWTYDSTNNKVTDVDKGLVIMDEKGNQFVWVPVSKQGSMYGTINGINAGKLYTGWSGTGITGTKSLLNWTETDGVVTRKIRRSGSNREPTLVSSSYDGGSYTSVDTTKTYLSIISELLNNSKYGTKYKDKYKDRTEFGKTMQDDYDKMITSVIANEGFYIGRYEASLINEETRVVAGATSISAAEDSVNKWYGLYARQRSFADDNVLNSVDSSMIWGCQYDAMINWMQSTGIDVTAAANSSNNTAKNSDNNRRTGVVAKDKLNNIYDIFGLRVEWTMEANDTALRVSRGGDYNSDLSPSYRDGYGPGAAYINYGSRPTLYIQ